MKRKTLIRLINLAVVIVVVISAILYSQIDKITNESVSESVEQYELMLNGEKDFEKYVNKNFEADLASVIEANNYNEVEEFFVDSYVKDIDLEYVKHELKDEKIEVTIKVNSVNVNAWRAEFSDSLEDYLPQETVDVIKNNVEVDSDERGEHIGKYWVEYSNYLNNRPYNNKEIVIVLDKNYKMSDEQFNVLISELFNS